MTEPRVHREIERKLQVLSRFRIPALGGAGSGIGQVCPQPTVRLTAVYYDTADLRLARHHITLRRRTGGGDDGWHLKLPHSDQDARDELHLSLQAPGKPPAQFATMVLGITRGAALAPVATLHTERRPLLLLDETARPLAELTDDRVSVTIGGKVTSRFRELEIEAAEDRTAEDLHVVIEALIAAGAAESRFASKAVQALGPRALEPPDVAVPANVGPHDPAGAAVQAWFARHVAAFLGEDLRLRRGFPDAVHQMRVSARRLRSGLKVFAPLMDVEWAAAISDELAWIAGELGASRDREVLEGRLLAALDELGAKDGQRAKTVVCRELGRDAEQALLQVTDAMKSDRYLALLDVLVEATHAPRLTAAAAATAAEELPPLMHKTWKRLAREVRALRKKGHDREWHAARIRAKHARYAAEALVPVFGKPAKQLATQLERVTELLGRHQDAAVAAETARKLAEGKGVGGRAGYVLGLLHDMQRREVRSVRRQFRAVWPQIAEARRRRWLHDAP